MNERNRKLAEQAGMGHERWNTTAQFESFLDKFAELVVRECAEVSNQAEKQCQHPGTMMKKHFGVEE